ncbi:uncharacterized protein LOC130629359 [Hydractinia symbiolongicarpus]|uniref:uncharacterized protein LOC130629359 n=1 Tax=Hydractinia symbiolongicarpus TaxID=13093 RepID=UPI00254A793A|nr:uncharacterized protein LOC130629359 [Hydractinia symbiolongicarpus]
MVEIWKEESPYFKTLILEDRLHYKKKLTLENEVLLEDPFNIEEGNWTTDVKQLPDVCYPDIWNYLIETPSEFTKDKMKAYKSLESYNFFVLGHVHQVYIHKIEHQNFSFVKTKVLPSQRQGQKEVLYEVWVCIHKSGWILSANCTCMSGLGSACSHTGALLFKLQACTQLELNKEDACTSKLCEWNKARKRAHPAPLHKINFKRPKKNEKLPKIASPFKGTLEGFSRADPVKFCHDSQITILKELKQITPYTAVLTCISLKFRDDPSSGEDTDTAYETEENTVPELLTSFFDPCSVNYSEQKISQVCDKLYKNYKGQTDQKQYDNLTKITKDQSQSNKWMLYRAGRITSSNCKKAYTCNIQKPAISTIKSIMQYNENISTPSMKYGKESEPKAFKSFNEMMKTKHENFTVDITGLHINEKYHHIGASPDGLTFCKCHGKGLLEIKCPFNFQHGLENYKTHKNCPITNYDKMKETHEYYFQMQLQMLVTERNYCYFFVWSKKFLYQYVLIKMNYFVNH